MSLTLNSIVDPNEFCYSKMLITVIKINNITIKMYETLNPIITSLKKSKEHKEAKKVKSKKKKKGLRKKKKIRKHLAYTKRLNSPFLTHIIFTLLTFIP